MVNILSHAKYISGIIFKIIQGIIFKIIQDIIFNIKCYYNKEYHNIWTIFDGNHRLRAY